MFEPITVKWSGNEYTLPADQVLRAIAEVEEVLTLGELYTYQSLRKTVPLGKLSRAFAIVLRHAGAQANADEIYGAMFAGADLQAKALHAISVLQMLMIPPEKLRTPSGKSAATGKRAASSRKPTSS